MKYETFEFDVTTVLLNDIKPERIIELADTLREIAADRYPNGFNKDGIGIKINQKTGMVIVFSDDGQTLQLNEHGELEMVYTLPTSEIFHTAEEMRNLYFDSPVSFSPEDIAFLVENVIIESSEANDDSEELDDE
ncbi:hypothetical protein FACS1894188_13490 [Clostridia bacterium]|nr:hypothetical protein FACS1894188_13490 [Clostridia bacterium]